MSAVDVTDSASNSGVSWQIDFKLKFYYFSLYNKWLILSFTKCLSTNCDSIALVRLTAFQFQTTVITALKYAATVPKIVIAVLTIGEY